MLNKYAFLLFLSMSQWSFFANAQIVDPLEFFPHHEGDIWEYNEFDIGIIVDTVQNVITKDSLGNDGRYYISQTEYGNYILDTTNFEVRMKRNNIEALILKLDATVGNFWVVDSGEVETSYEVAHLVDEFPDNIFSQPVVVKKISYYSVNTLINDSLWLGDYYLASSFGLVGHDWELGGALRIKGVIIDSIRYGTVTALEGPSRIQVPEKAVLYQNYPNPFNPLTTIQYQIIKTEKVELVIYDLLGREAAVLVNEVQTPGSYQIQFNAQNLSSGTYLYQLRTPSKAINQKMLLVK